MPDSARDESLESALIRKFTDFMQHSGHTVQRFKITPAGEANPIFTDAYVRDLKILVETKGTADRNSIRMAIGQLLDYRRFISEENVRCAVLLPEIPRPDLLQLLAHCDAFIYFPEKGTFVLMDGRGKRYDKPQPIPDNPFAPCHARRRTSGSRKSSRPEPVVSPACAEPVARAVLAALATLLKEVSSANIQSVPGRAENILVKRSRESLDRTEADSRAPFQPQARLVRNNAKHNVFIVHGHDHAARDAVSLFLHHIGLNPVILSEVEDSGRTIIEKFEELAGQADFAIVLLTPDDVTTNVGSTTRRARQNVVFELGYFVAKLGRDKVCLLRKGDVERFSDFDGVIYQTMDEHEKWKTRLAQELKAAGLAFDPARLLT